MGYSYPPTAADYAMSAANDAQRENKSLGKRVDELEAEMRAALFFIERLLEEMPQEFLDKVRGDLEEMNDRNPSV